jgi:phosphomannomutase
MRSEPIKELDGSKVTFKDFSEVSNGLPATDAIQLDLEDGRRVIVRPSGTEPKLKCYLQAVSTDEAVAHEGLANLKQAMQEVLS